MWEVNILEKYDIALTLTEALIQSDLIGFDSNDIGKEVADLFNSIYKNINTNDNAATR